MTTLEDRLRRDSDHWQQAQHQSGIDLSLPERWRRRHPSGRQFAAAVAMAAAIAVVPVVMNTLSTGQHVHTSAVTPPDTTAPATTPNPGIMYFPAPGLPTWMGSEGPMWPMAAGTKFATPLAVARSFAHNVLGLPAQDVTVKPDPRNPDFSTANIRLPALGLPLELSEVKRPGDSWTIDAVDETSTHGVYFEKTAGSGMGVKDERLYITFTAPKAAASGEVFDLTDAGYRHSPLTNTELRQGRVTLPGTKYRMAFVVLRDSGHRPIAILSGKVSPAPAGTRIAP